jgi:hypothetical protein
VKAGFSLDVITACVVVGDVLDVGSYVTYSDGHPSFVSRYCEVHTRGE